MFRAALGEALPTVLTSDLAAREQQLRAVSRHVFGAVVERVATAQARGVERGVCPGCGGRLHSVDPARARHLQGLVGDYTLRRAYFQCVACGQGHAPLDAQLGLGTGTLSPGLLRVVCREGIEGSFEDTAERVAEAVGVTVSDEVVRRMTEGLGAVAEAEVQAAIARVQRGQPAWNADAVVNPPQSGVLAVEVDGLYVHRDDDWHEMKVVTVAPLGPGVEVDADTGRARLAWGRASYGAGFEAAEEFWYRASVEASRRGLGTPAVRTVVVLGDAAEWIWHYARAFLALPGVEVVEIIDLSHAYEYLWAVGSAVFGAETPAAAAWVEPLKTRLYEEGAAPVRAALEALLATLSRAAPVPDTENGPLTAVRRALEYVTTHAARLDYPAFRARQLPIGSGAVESAGKSVIQARIKGAGMRWSGAGAQQVVALRALHRSGRWDAFWRAQPQRARLLLFPRQRRTRPAPASLPAPPLRSTPAPEPGREVAPAPLPPPPRPLRPAPDHPWRRLPIGRARSA